LAVDSLRQRSVDLSDENNVKAGSVTDEERSTLTLLADMQEIPLSDRVYPHCQQDIAVVIILLYVDNTRIRSNCLQLVEKLHADVRATRQDRLSNTLFFALGRIGATSLTASCASDNERNVLFQPMLGICAGLDTVKSLTCNMPTPTRLHM
jgi:hypothetical protein